MHSIRRTVLVFVLAATTAGASVVNGDLTVDSFAAFAGQTNIVLQATGNITFTGGTLNLPDLPSGAVSGLFLVQAGNDVVVNDGVTVVAGSGWSVVLVAGTTNFDVTIPTISDGGNISFLGTASLVVEGGSINLLAGDSISVADGAIGTTGGVESLTALMGSVSTGSGGQIGTTAGGTVSISAGEDVSGTILGTITNLTAGGITIISTGPAVPIDGGSSGRGHTNEFCLHGRFKAGHQHDHFKCPHSLLRHRGWR